MVGNTPKRKHIFKRRTFTFVLRHSVNENRRVVLLLILSFVDHFQINVSPDKGFVESEKKQIPISLKHEVKVVFQVIIVCNLSKG